MCVCIYVYACVRACVRASVRACVRSCVRVCVCVFAIIHGATGLMNYCRNNKSQLHTNKSTLLFNFHFILHFPSDSMTAATALQATSRKRLPELIYNIKSNKVKQHF